MPGVAAAAKQTKVCVVQGPEPARSAGAADSRSGSCSEDETASERSPDTRRDDESESSDGDETARRGSPGKREDDEGESSSGEGEGEGESPSSSNEEAAGPSVEDAHSCEEDASPEHGSAILGDDGDVDEEEA